jgi:hypothetical protein
MLPTLFLCLRSYACLFGVSCSCKAEGRDEPVLLGSPWASFMTDRQTSPCHRAMAPQPSWASATAFLLATWPMGLPSRPLGRLASVGFPDLGGNCAAIADMAHTPLKPSKWDVRDGTFAEQVQALEEPMLFQGLHPASTWPAVSRWDPAYLSRHQPILENVYVQRGDDTLFSYARDDEGAGYRVQRHMATASFFEACRAGNSSPAVYYSGSVGAWSGTPVKDVAPWYRSLCAGGRTDLRG